MEQKQCYAFKHGDDKIRRVSTSGGAFSALAECIIDNNGVVYGASLDNADMSVQHIRIDQSEHISKLRGSKYLQSVIGETFKQAKKDLEDGKKVLFSGTPCQIAGLKQYLEKKYFSLYTCDIICHGVSSPLIWREYIKYKEKELGRKVKGACFRDKEDYLWSNCKEVLYLEKDNNRNYDKYPADEYAKIFYDHEAMRPSCYKCHYANMDRPGDITLGDFWGVEKTHPEIFDEIGISFIIQNTSHGCDLVKMLSTKGTLVDAKIEETRQPQLYKPVREPSTRRWFWRTYEKHGLERIIQANQNNLSMINVRRNMVSNGKIVVRGMINLIKTLGDKFYGR